MPWLRDDGQTFVQVTEGAITVLDERGFGGLSWPAVAQAARMSASAVRQRCDLDRDQLIRLTVIALRRARSDRVDQVLGEPWLVSARRREAHQDPRGDEANEFLLREATARLPRDARDRKDSRVWWLLAREPALPESSRVQVAAELARNAQWCRAMFFDDPAGALHLELLLNALDEAIARSHEPLGLDATAEPLRRACLRPRAVPEPPEPQPNAGPDAQLEAAPGQNPPPTFRQPAES